MYSENITVPILATREDVLINVLIKSYTKYVVCQDGSNM